MIIKRIGLKNFRQYIDTEIVFSTDEEKNITLIMGDNGTGKTTLAQAFQWALYGNTGFQIKELINRKVREGMTLGVSKPVSVSLDINYNNRDYTIKRLVTYKKMSATKIEEDGHAKFTISYTDENGVTEYVPDYQKPYLIKKILPEDLSQFFFFDGEKIETMSKNIQEGKGENFRSAVYSLVGLSAMQNAIQHLQSSSSSKMSVIKKLRMELEKNNKSAQSLQAYNQKIEELTNKIDGKNADAQKLSEEIDAIEKALDKNKQIVYSETPKMQIKEQYEKLQSELKALKHKKNDYIGKDLLREFQKGIFSFCMIPLMEKDDINKLLEEGIPSKKVVPGLTKKTIEYLLNKKECICGTCLQEGTLPYQSVESFLEFAYPKTIGMLKEEFTKEKKKIKREGEGFVVEFKRKMEELYEINAKIEARESEIAELMDQLGNTSKGEEAKQQIKLLEVSKKKKNDELVSILAVIKDLEKQRERQNTEKEKLVIVDDDTRKYQEYIAYAEELHKRMSRAYANKENEYRRKLEQGMNKIFESIYDGNIKIEIDDRYRILVNVDEGFDFGDEVERNTAQSYALIFAFITAVIELAKEKVNKDALNEEEKIDTDKEGYPLVMDAPLSAFDTTRIKSICTEIPRIADQVIMFIKDTDGNVAEQYMNEKIGKRYNAVKVNGSNLESDVQEVDI